MSVRTLSEPACGNHNPLTKLLWLALKQFKLDFNGEVFSFADDQPRVEEINLQSHYVEPGTFGTTYLRENLALQLFQARPPALLRNSPRSHPSPCRSIHRTSRCRLLTCGGKRERVASAEDRGACVLRGPHPAASERRFLRLVQLD